MSNSKRFWDALYEDRHAPPALTAATENRTEAQFLTLLSDVNGLRVLEVGCGTGELSVFLAQQGAHVTATDYSAYAVEQTRECAEAQQVGTQVSVHKVEALDLKILEQTYDLIVGRFLLHHIEPFDAFVEVLYDRLKPGGRIVFMENSARNPLLRLARKTLVGRFGIPKHGDDDEHPLEPRELRMIDRRFEQSRRLYPELIFFRLLNTYIFRDARVFAPLILLNEWMDRLLYRVAPALRKYSYYQILEAAKSPEETTQRPLEGKPGRDENGLQQGAAAEGKTEPARLQDASSALRAQSWP